MTLMLIVIAALSEAGLARRSLQLALDARHAQESLSDRWLVQSTRRFFLERADDIFWRFEKRAAERSPQWPAERTIALKFQAGDGIAIRAVLADEDAKTNLNAVYARRPAEIRSLLQERTSGGLSPTLSPDLHRDARLRKRWFSSWGQVYDVAELFSQRRGEQLIEATNDVTCFGAGKPNIRRASDGTLRDATLAVASGETARKLTEARRDFEGDLLLPDLLAKLALRRAEALKLKAILSDRSLCYSLWIDMERDSRKRYYLWVAGDPGANDQTASFIW